MTDLLSAADLTFVTRNEADGSLNLWTPERPADYASACAMGRDYAAELHGFMTASGNPVVFGAVLRAISAGGIFGGVETGFCSAFGIALLGVDRIVPAPAGRPLAHPVS